MEHLKSSTALSRRTIPRVVTVTGHGVRLRVWLRSLWVEDGFRSDGEARRRTLTRATTPLDRILFLAGSGALSVDALDWCATNGVSVVAVDQSGEPRWTLLPGAGGAWQARLRRAAALAPFTQTGLVIAKFLVQRKIEAQRDVLRDLSRRVPALRSVWPKCAVPEALTALETILPRIEQAATIPALRQVEAEAADAYWSGWIGLPLHFAPPSYLRKVSVHWTAFRGRGSPLNNGNRNAADPVNALLNYAYALLEAEALLAAHETGLDPYIDASGLHTDQDTRRSLVYSLMEPIRPVADRLVLNLLLSHVFRPEELWLLRDGRCRLDQDLCAQLWPWMPEFRGALGPVMTFLLSRLRHGPKYGERTAYRLVEVTPPVRTRAPLGQKRWAREASPPAIRLGGAGVCRSCGVLLEEQPDRLYCDDCLPARREETVASAGEVGRAVLARLRSEGRDAAHGGTAARQRGAKVGRWNRERTRWSAPVDGAISPEVFRREILPRLRRLPVGQIARVIGASPGYASFIRRGLRVPHPRHWPILRALVAKEAIKMQGA